MLDGTRAILQAHPEIAFFLVLGLATLGAYIKIGEAHADRAGERYVPTWLR